MATTGRYLLENRHAAAGVRLQALSALFDPSTFSHFDRLGVGPASRCWEVGAGGRSVVDELARRVGPDGYVLATDLDLTWAGPSADGGGVETVRGAPVELARHDVVADELPEGPFDLVHARLLLVHLPEREAVIDRLRSCLRRGGHLFLEDADPALQPLSCIDPTGRPGELANEIRQGFRALLAQRGADLAFGRRLPRLLRDAGLVDVEADAYLPVAMAECIPLELATLELIEDDLLDNGVVSRDELDEHRANVARGLVDLSQPPMISASGRRPS